MEKLSKTIVTVVKAKMYWDLLLLMLRMSEKNPWLLEALEEMVEDMRKRYEED